MWRDDAFEDELASTSPADSGPPRPVGYLLGSGASSALGLLAGTQDSPIVNLAGYLLAAIIGLLLVIRFWRADTELRKNGFYRPSRVLAAAARLLAGVAILAALPSMWKLATYLATPR